MPTLVYVGICGIIIHTGKHLLLKTIENLVVIALSKPFVVVRFISAGHVIENRAHRETTRCESQSLPTCPEAPHLRDRTSSRRAAGSRRRETRAWPRCQSRRLSDGPGRLTRGSRAGCRRERTQVTRATRSRRPAPPSISRLGFGARFYFTSVTTSLDGSLIWCCRIRYSMLPPLRNCRKFVDGIR